MVPSEGACKLPIDRDYSWACHRATDGALPQSANREVPQGFFNRRGFVVALFSKGRSNPFFDRFANFSEPVDNMPA
jgi:hypothetical protein